MNQSELMDTLRLVVREFGFEVVERSLHEIAISDRQRKRSHGRSVKIREDSAIRPSRSKSSSTSEYVAKMDLSQENAVVVSERARKCDEKSFLPTFGDRDQRASVAIARQRRSEGLQVHRGYGC